MQAPWLVTKPGEQVLQVEVSEHSRQLDGQVSQPLPLGTKAPLEVHSRQVVDKEAASGLWEHSEQFSPQGTQRPSAIKWVSAHVVQVASSEHSKQFNPQGKQDPFPSFIKTAVSSQAVQVAASSQALQLLPQGEHVSSAFTKKRGLQPVHAVPLSQVAQLSTQGEQVPSPLLKKPPVLQVVQSLKELHSWQFSPQGEHVPSPLLKKAVSQEVQSEGELQPMQFSPQGEQVPSPLLPNTPSRQVVQSLRELHS